MSPPPGYLHGSFQFNIGVLLRSALPNGRVSTECPISTADGVRAADVAWISRERLATIGENVCLTSAPEICVEVLSPDNTPREMQEKRALYFAAGAAEVWQCDCDGHMTFFPDAISTGEPKSRFCPTFPSIVTLT